jgi:hypothetical protein
MKKIKIKKLILKNQIESQKNFTKHSLKKMKIFSNNFF